MYSTNEIKFKLSVTSQSRCVSNKTQLCTALVQVMNADIPMKIMFENTPSVHITIYRGNIRQLETVCIARQC